MTAFSSPDLKAFPLTLQVFQILRGRSKARLCLSCLSSSARHVGHHPSCETCALAVRLTSAATPSESQPRQPQTRHPSHQRWYVLLLSDRTYQWRKDPHLPSQPPSSATCRALTGLPPVAFVVSFRICSRRRENRPQTPQAKEDTYARKWGGQRTASHARKKPLARYI